MIAQRTFLFFIFFALFAGFGTYYTFNIDNLKILKYFIYADIFFIISFLVLLILKIIEIWGRRQGYSTHIYRQNILLYTLVAIIPSIFIFLVNYIFVNQGIEEWFGQPVKLSLEVSQNIADAYIDTTQTNLKHAVRLILERLKGTLYTKNASERDFVLNNLPQFLEYSINAETDQFGFSEAMIINQNRDVIARSELTLAMQFEVSPEHIAHMLQTEEVIAFRNNDRIRVLGLIGPVGNDFLFLAVGKILEPKIVSDINHAYAAISNYTVLQNQKSGLQLTVTLIMGVLTLLIVLITVWFGFHLAERLMRPISELIITAQKIKDGQWNIRANESTTSGELKTLIHTFNMMLDQIYEQHNALAYAKNLNDTIINNISTGIIVCEENGIIQKTNESAKNILGKTGENVRDLSNDINAIFKNLGMHSLVVSTKKGLRTLKLSNFRIENEHTYIIAFEDVTDLLLAQKQDSWREIARRIAHEIKNPLTPIQLSAERLKKRYSHQIQQDRQIFDDCIDIIIRQVQSIFTLIKQLTSFAKTIVPQMKPVNLSELCSKMIVFFKETNTDIEFDFSHNKMDTIVTCDEQQIQQVILNLLNNAVAILEENHVPKKHIKIDLEESDETVYLSFIDNGPGFPEEIMHKLTEPYVTLRKNGSGIGLAVVSKILEDHGALLKFDNIHEDSASTISNGAKVTIIFRKTHVV